MAKHENISQGMEEQLLYLIKNIPNLIVTTNRDGIIQFLNKTIIDSDGQEITGRSIYEFGINNNRNILEKALKKAFDKKEKTSFEIKIDITRERYVWLSVQAGPLIQDNNVIAAMFIAEDITETKKARAALERRLTFENLLSTISTDFINMSVKMIDKGIRMSIKLLATFTHVKCAAVFLFNKDCTHVEKSYIWCKDPGDPMYKSHINRTFNKESYIFGQLLLYRNIKLEKQTDLPSGKNDMLFYKHGFRPVLIIPMLLKGKLYGAIGLCDTPGQEKKWEEEYIPLLKFFSDILVNAILRKNKEEALCWNEARLRGVLKAAKNVAFIICNTYETNPEILEFSTGAESIFGYSREEILGKSIFILHLPSEIKRFPNTIKRMKKGKTGFSGENVLIKKGGEPFPALYSTYPLFDERGVVTSFLCVIIDITDRKIMEQALLDAEQEKALILSSVSELVTYMDPKLNIIWANRAACESVGLTHDKLEGKHCYEIWHKDNTYVKDCPVVKSIKTGIPQDGEVTTPDGRVWFIRGYPIRSQQGTVMGVVEVTREITRLKKAEGKLRLTQFSIDHASVATFWVNRDAKFDYVNTRACISLGYSREELLNMKVYDIDPHCTEKKWPEHWENIRRRGSFTIETEHRKKDGTLFPVEIFVNYLNFEGNEYNFAFARDLTEKKRSAEEKSKLEEQLLQARKMEALGRLAGGVAHDFNNILTGMQGYVHFIKMSLPAENPLQKDVREIKHAIERAAGLTEQLLAFSKKQVVTPQILNINTLVDDAQHMLSRIIGEDINLIVLKEIKYGYIKFDAHQMDQILVNLAVNARDAMLKGGTLCIETTRISLNESITASHSEIKPGEYILLRISDTGHGIDNQIKDHIFEPFFTARKQGRGAGLGLSTVYGIIKQHEGFINVITNKDRGTMFEIYIPAVNGEFQNKDEVIEQFINLKGGNETILLVEDEEMVRTFTKRFLSYQGYNVLEVSHPHEAGQLCITYECPIDLLLTDVVMPEMNGKELYEKLKHVIPGLKVLYMSGYSGDILAHHGVLDDDTNFIYKPFTIEALTSKIRMILDGE
ncbi:MAG: PAS domain S-box protein [Spirochaetales bacterium]|nr:PAS domain S-box protein [Spirochaetales bacterium]